MSRYKFSIAHRSTLCTAFAALTCMIATAAVAADSDSKKTGALPPGIIFSEALEDVPGKDLTVVSLKFPPYKGPPSTTEHHPVGHRHPGSVYVYVTRGVLRLGIEGQPVREVHAGDSFFEPPGVVHTVAESASATESAEAIAVMIVPKGAPLVTMEQKK